MKTKHNTETGEQTVLEKCFNVSVNKKIRGKKALCSLAGGKGAIAGDITKQKKTDQIESGLIGN